VSKNVRSRRTFLRATVAATGAAFFSPRTSIGQTAFAPIPPGQRSETGPADYILRIAASPVEMRRKLLLFVVSH
jgi:hypothetical protein